MKTQARTHMMVEVSRNKTDHIYAFIILRAHFIYTYRIQITDYEDLCELIHIFESCSAYMWYNERVEKYKKLPKLYLSLCWIKGKITLPKLREPPSMLSDLVFMQEKFSEHFQKHIRSHNMMFSFTPSIFF